MGSLIPVTIAQCFLTCGTQDLFKWYMNSFYIPTQIKLGLDIHWCCNKYI